MFLEVRQNSDSLEVRWTTFYLVGICLFFLSAYVAGTLIIGIENISSSTWYILIAALVALVLAMACANLIRLLFPTPYSVIRKCLVICNEGICACPDLSCVPKMYHWGSISSIYITDKVRITRSAFGRGGSFHVIIIIFDKTVRPLTFLQRTKLGRYVGPEGSECAMIHVPKKSESKVLIHSAVSKYSNNLITTTVCKRVELNYREKEILTFGRMVF